MAVAYSYDVRCFRRRTGRKGISLFPTRKHCREWSEWVGLRRHVSALAAPWSTLEHPFLFQCSLAFATRSQSGVVPPQSRFESMHGHWKVGSPRYHFANSTQRVSRTTVTRIWPGYESSASILREMLR